MPYWLVAAFMVPVWCTVMAVGGGYEPRILGVGSEEFRRGFNAAMRFLALVVIVFYLLNVDLARGFVAAFVPLPRCSRCWVATAPADCRTLTGIGAAPCTGCS